MAVKQNGRIGWSLAFSVVLLLFVAYSLDIIPRAAEICATPCATCQPTCSNHNIFYFAFWSISQLLNNYNGLITALATVVIAAFTYTLRAASLEQGRLTKRSVEIAEKSLVDLERARVYFGEITDNGVEFPKPDTVTFRAALKYNIINHGKTPAVITEILQRDVITRSGDKIELPSPIDMVTEQGLKQPSGTAVGSGKSYEIWHPISDTNPLELIPWKLVNLFFIGYIRYEDIFRKKHRVGFCHYYDHDSDTFRMIGGESYNYTTEE